jgi:hypothetical protein
MFIGRHFVIEPPNQHMHIFTQAKIMANTAIELMNRSGFAGKKSSQMRFQRGAHSLQRLRSPAANNIGPWDGVDTSQLSNGPIIHAHGNKPMRRLSNSELLQFPAEVDRRNPVQLLEGSTNISEDVAHLIISDTSMYRNPPNTTNRLKTQMADNNVVSFAGAQIVSSTIGDKKDDYGNTESTINKREPYKCSEISFRLNWRPSYSHTRRRKEFRGKSQLFFGKRLC